MNTEVQKVGWDDFLNRIFKWRQGEHVTLIGPTGQGKTTLARHILPQRNYVVNFVTKKKDTLIGEFKRDGYKVMKLWETPHQSVPRVLLQPAFAKDEPRERHQREGFKLALDRAFDETGWTVYLDEVLYITNDLSLERQVKRLWHQGRSLKVSVVAGTQRPALVPLLAYSQATHLFFWRNTDHNDMRRLGSLGGVDNKLIQGIVGQLPKYEVLYLNTRTSDLVQTKVRK
jgi:hypothetical protein